MGSPLNIELGILVILVWTSFYVSDGREEDKTANEKIWNDAIFLPMHRNLGENPHFLQLLLIV